MINLEELRIGNKLRHATKGIVTLTGIGGSTLMYQGVDHEPGAQSAFADIKFFTPIPLTPEILDSCNLPFEKVDREDSRPRAWLVKDDLYIGRLTEHEYYVGIAYTDRFESWELAVVGQPLKYLHQAQNAIFALTGQELTVQQKQPV